jgi:hypothetical protein
VLGSWADANRVRRPTQESSGLAGNSHAATYAIAATAVAAQMAMATIMTLTSFRADAEAVARPRSGARLA